MKYKYIIIGCGIGGLAAAAELKSKGEDNFLIVDRCKEVPLNLHNGVHYLHTNDFGTPFPFELKEIVSTEEIWIPRRDEFKKQAHVPEMVDYSVKVMGLRHPSSIMDPSSRVWKTYIPLSNNMNDLIIAYKEFIGEDKFELGSQLVSIKPKEQIAEFNKEGFLISVQYEHLISTAPLKSFGDLCGIELNAEFKNAPLFITNYKTEKIVPNWLICLYISDNKFPVYRITILNNIISMESLAKLTLAEEHIIKYHLDRYFEYELESKQDYLWDTGRIWGLDKTTRERIVKLFQDDRIRLLGRYGNWDGKLEMTGTILQAKQIINEIL